MPYDGDSNRILESVSLKGQAWCRQGSKRVFTIWSKPYITHSIYIRNTIHHHRHTPPSHPCTWLSQWSCVCNKVPWPTLHRLSSQSNSQTCQKYLHTHRSPQIIPLQVQWSACQTLIIASNCIRFARLLNQRDGNIRLCTRITKSPPGSPPGSPLGPPRSPMAPRGGSDLDHLSIRITSSMLTHPTRHTHTSIFRIFLNAFDTKLYFD